MIFLSLLFFSRKLFQAYKSLTIYNLYIFQTSKVKAVSITL